MSRHWLWLLLAMCGWAQAHPLAPALLQLSEDQPGHYRWLWRTGLPVVEPLRPIWPAICNPGEAIARRVENAQTLVESGDLHCTGELRGEVLAVEGLGSSRRNVIVRLQFGDGSSAEALLGAAQPSFAVPGMAQRAVEWRYLQLGIEHLLTGLDHLLFVLGLLVLVRSLRMLLMTVTAFTLGHSLTLSLVALNWLQVPPALAEIGIAISLVALGLEILREPAASPGRWQARPWQMAAAFGLIHGLGFAGALAEIGLPKNSIVMALLSFNVGIELGQLLVVGVVLLVVHGATRAFGPRALRSRWAAAIPAYLLGSLGVYWCLMRSADFLL